MRKNKVIKYAIFLLLLGIIFLSKDVWAPPAPSGPVIADYTAYPPFVVGSSDKPNVMILFSNDHTNYYKGYNDTLDMDDDGTPETTYKNSIEYYGYFDSDKCYSNTFVPSGYASNHYCSGNWSGNFLNWATMSHGDFVRKALTGGKRVMDSATKTTLKRADIYDNDHSWNKVYSGTDINQLTPFSGTKTFRSRDTKLYVRDGNYPSITCSDSNDWTYPDTGTGCDSTAPSNEYTVEVEVCNNSVGLESNCKTYQDVGVTTYKPAGLLVRYADQLRFGLMTYSVDSYQEQGGILRRNVKDIVDEINPNGTINSGIADGIIRYINDFTHKGWDPVGELYYEAIRYFKALCPTTSYRCGGGGPTDDGYPMYCNQSASRMWSDPMLSYCHRNYIVIVNDEYPSKDHDKLPNAAYGTGVSPNETGIDTYYWTNLVGQLEGINGTSRSVGATTCTVSGTDCTNATTCSSQLINNLGNVVGICPSEPTTEGTFNIAGLAYYAHTQDLRSGFQQSQLINKTYAIAYRASPGGYQIPPPPMNQLWLAAKYGSFEDTNGNGVFDPGIDVWDEDGDGIPDTYFVAEKGSDFENAFNSILADILGRESSGTSASILATTGEGEGAVYQAYFIPKKTVGSTDLTWLGYLHGLFMDKYGNIREDTNNNDTLDYIGDYIVRMYYDTTVFPNRTKVNKYQDVDGMGGTGLSLQIVPGSPFELRDIIPFWEAGRVLWATNPTNRKIKTSLQDTCGGATICSTIDFSVGNKTQLRPYLRASNDNEAEAIIRYIKGEDTPFTIGSTTYNYRTRTMDIGGTSNTWKFGDIVYSTPTAVAKPSENYDILYHDATYAEFKAQYKNRRHVVYAGANDGMLHAFNSGVFNPTTHSYSGAGYALGEELWAFIPQSLLPHLKWLTDVNYTHVYYVDLKPKVVDARIFAADSTHKNGWGTVLIGGMRYGGRDISYKDTAFGAQAKTFYSAYFAIDITNPEDPSSYGKLLWVYTDPSGDLNMTTSYPAVLRTGGDSIVPGTWHVVFGSGPTSYTGASTKSGKIYVLNLATGALVRKFDNQAVLMDRAFMADPITIDVDLDYQVDSIYIGNTYCGSASGCTSSTWRGKMYRISTGENSDPNAWIFPSVLFDPQQPVTSAPAAAMDEQTNLWIYFGTGRFLHVYDKSLDGTERWSFYAIKDTCKPWINPTCTTTITKANLFIASNVDVCKGGTVTTCSANAMLWRSILTAAESKDGWYVDFPSPGERAVFKPLVLGGLAVWTTYISSTDPCAFEGNSRIYATFYKTGTAYKEFVFVQPASDILVLRSADLGKGVPSSVGAAITGENTVTGFVQQSTGTIVQIEQKTPFAVKSGFVGWKQEVIP